MKKFKFKINGNQYEVAINDIKDNIANLEVNGVAYNVEIEKDTLEKNAAPVRKVPKTSKPVSSTVSKKVVDTAKKPEAADTRTATASSDAHPVRSPLPGVILNVLVKEGDKIAKGDVLLVMEAMKMENNIASDKDGVVAAVKVTNGQSILQNEILVEIQ